MMRPSYRSLIPHVPSNEVKKEIYHPLVSLYRFVKYTALCNTQRQLTGIYKSIQMLSKLFTIP